SRFHPSRDECVLRINPKWPNVKNHSGVRYQLTIYSKKVSTPQMSPDQLSRDGSQCGFATFFLRLPPSETALPRFGSAKVAERFPLSNKQEIIFFLRSAPFLKGLKCKECYSGEQKKAR